MEDPLHDAGLYYIPKGFEKTGQKFNSAWKLTLWKLNKRQSKSKSDTKMTPELGTTTHRNIRKHCVLHSCLMSKTWWDFSITRSVNTPLPAPWQHSWECRMFTCLETVYLTTSNTSFLHLICYIWNGASSVHSNLLVLFSPCKKRTLLAIRCCKHPTESLLN